MSIEKTIIKLQKSEKSKIMIVGDLILDMYVHGTINRLSREAPVPIVSQKNVELCCGGAANVALNCKAIGMDPILIGLVGANDENGKHLLKQVESEKISTSNIVLSQTRKTTAKTRVMVENHQVLRIDEEKTGEIEDFDKQEIYSKIKSQIHNTKVILISDYGQELVDRSLIEKVLDYAKSYDVKIIADPRGPNFEKYEGINWLKLNEDEFYEAIISLSINTKLSAIDQGMLLCEKLKLEGVIQTLGKNGMRLISKKAHIEIPAERREVFDVTGAGDTVLAYLGCSLSANIPMTEAINLANKAAGISVSRIKNYAVPLSELSKETSTSKNNKIYEDWSSLRKKLEELRSKKKTIVMTNGCFDVIHPGHIELLEKAKAMGNVLVVAINTDESIKRIKGKNRPICTEKNRAKVLASLSSVDFVCTFDEDTPYEIMEFIKPDIHVKGGDYKIEDLNTTPLVHSYNGSVKIVDLKEGFSTTNLIERIRKPTQASC